MAGRGGVEMKTPSTPGREEFSIRSERRGPMHRIAARGTLGPRASFRLHDEFYRALPTDAAAIVVDLSEVTAVNRGAINTLAFMRRRSGKRVRIIPSRQVAEAVRGLAAQAGRDRSTDTGPAAERGRSAAAGRARRGRSS
jgi:STAS domain